MPAPTRHPCPTCGREVAPPSVDAAGVRARTPFPFCSPACKLVDLGRWLDGEYRVPGGDEDGQPAAFEDE